MTEGHGALRLAYLGDPNSIHTRRWMAFFAERGHAVALLVASDVAVEPGLDERIRILRYASPARHRIPGRAALEVRRALRRVLADLEPDVLHAHSLTRYAWLGRLSGFHPFVVTLWGSDILLAPWASRRAWLQGRLILRAADVVTVAARHLGTLALRLGARADRLVPLHFGVDTARFRPFPPDPEAWARLGVGGLRVLLSPRALTPLYRHETVLQAVASLSDEVVVVSSGRRAAAGHPERLQALARELGIGGRFVILPEIPDDERPRLMAAADVIVSVPESDSLSLTVVEGMAAGTPVVASDLAGPREALEEHPELLVPVGDAAALTAALSRILAMPEAERSALGGDLRRVVTDRYEYRTNMLAMEQVYRRLTRRPSTRP
jgi:glycosyltransferase involved in cell wall biosynthesis